MIWSGILSKPWHWGRMEGEDTNRWGSQGAGPPPLPFVPQPWGPWWTLLWGALVFLVWQMTQGLLVALLVFLKAGAEGLKGERFQQEFEILMKDGEAAGLLTFGSGLVGVIALMAVVKIRGLSFAQGLGMGLPRVWWSWLVAIPATFFFVLFAGGLMQLVFPQKEVEPFMIEMIDGTDNYALLLLGVVVAAPVFEELFFRGFLQEGLGRSRLTRWGAVLVLALVFSLIHGQYENPQAFVMLFGLGVLFGVAKEVTGSVWVPVAMHAFNNLFATVSVWLMANGYLPEEVAPRNEVPETSPELPVSN